jgi:lipopolysaccharide transport system ATP-binding protein
MLSEANVSDSIITVENLGKKYSIRHQQQNGRRYKALRDVLTDQTKSVVRRLWSAMRRPMPSSPLDKGPSSEAFWALKEVCFEVKQGDVLGIIGRNGAGKSTLLKILSRITEPSEGRVTLRGRVASLLEVGTGFHPELTGRENILLNGAILGMHRAEIRRKFDEIVAFAEVEKFLDTPVKRYSSGMYVRLAFAVAAHLEPEILIVDEVLAVGDMDFQKKCLGKMSQVAKGGRTVLFVSHNMDAVLRLCSLVIRLETGRVAGLGSPTALVSEYLRGNDGVLAARRWDAFEKQPGNDVARLAEVFAHDEQGKKLSTFDTQRPIGITMEYEVLRGDIPLVDNFNVHNEQGIFLFVAHNVRSPYYDRRRSLGRYRSTAWIPGNLLAEGFYSVSAALDSESPFRVHFHVDQAISFHVTDSMKGDSARGVHVGPFPGVVRPLLDWDVRPMAATPPAAEAVLQSPGSLA